MKSLSIIIPAYNEERTLLKILDAVFAVELTNGITKEVIVVNDCSTDKTQAIIDNYILLYPNYNIVSHQHEVNQGKGAAIHRGIKSATGDYTVIQDADLEYDPEEFNDLIRPILKDNADVVYGSRFMGSKPHRILFFWHTIGNKFLTMLSNLFSNLNLTDMETCYKMIRTSTLQSLNLTEKRFGFEPEVTAKLSRIKRIKFYEVGISYYGRTYEDGKKIGWKDGIRAIYCILKYGLLRWR